MKKIISILLPIVLLVCFAVTSFAGVTNEDVQNLTDYTRETFFSEELPVSKNWHNKIKALAVTPEQAQDPEFLSSKGLISMQPLQYIMITTLAWQAEYGPGNPPWTIPQQVIKDPNAEIYLLYNTTMLDSMNDEALLGISLNNIFRFVDAKADFTIKMCSFGMDGSPVMYDFREKAIDALIISTKDQLGATIPIYEFRKWSEATFPPLGENTPQDAGMTPEDIRTFYFRLPNWLTINYPEYTLEELLGPVPYENYLYLLNN